MQRLVVLPPGSPQPAVDALRAVVLRLNDDQDFAQEAMSALGYVPSYEAGPDTNRQVRAALTVSPEIRTFVLDSIKNAKK
jgi:tripartite-type tricarboxylate transporter receptor subunit TctC